MTTITWKDKKTGAKKIQTFRSKDKLTTTLQLLSYDEKERVYYLTNKKNKKVVSVEEVIGVSYESEDEKALFSTYGLIPKKEDYPNA